MKKLLNISVIAALAILPMVANAAPVAGDPVNIDKSTLNPKPTADSVTASDGPKYELAEANEAVDGVLATAGYVKGAYNAAIKAINKVSETADGAVQSVTEGSTNGAILVDGTPVAVHGLGSAAYTDSTAYISSSAGSVKTANIDDGQVTKEKLATAVQTSLDGAVQGVTLNGTALTETDGVVNVTAVQSVTTGTANGTVKVDNTDVPVAGWATKQDALSGTQIDAVNSGIDATKVAAYEQLVTNSANYATKTGVETTVTGAFTGATANLSGLGVTNNAVTGTATASVPVVTTWGATTAGTPISATVDLTNVSSNVALTGNTTGAITAGNIAYPAN